MFFMMNLAAFWILGEHEKNIQKCESLQGEKVLIFGKTFYSENRRNPAFATEIRKRYNDCVDDDAVFL